MKSPENQSFLCLCFQQEDGGFVVLVPEVGASRWRSVLQTGQSDTPEHHRHAGTFWIYLGFNPHQCVPRSDSYTHTHTHRKRRCMWCIQGQIPLFLFSTETPDPVGHLHLCYLVRLFIFYHLTSSHCGFLYFFSINN